MSFLRKSGPVAAFILSLISGRTLLGQSCSTQEFDAQKIVYRSEVLPIEMSGFFPYVLNGATPAKKYVTETWSGGGMATYPGCGCYVGYSDINWSGNWSFSKGDFTDSSSKSVSYVKTGCGGDNPAAYSSNNIKGGLLDAGGIASAPPTSSSATSLHAYFPDDPSFSSCVFGYIFGHTDVTESLDGEFTLKDAVDRAEAHKTVAYNIGNLQYWNNNTPATDADVQLGYTNASISRISPILAHANRVSFQATFCQPCLGGGKFLITYYYKHWSQGQSEPGNYETATDEVTFKDPPFQIPQSGYKAYKFDLKQGEQCKLMRITARKICEQGEAGDGKGQNHSVEMLYQLGKRPDGSAAGGLEVRSETVAPVLYTPVALQLIASDNTDVTVVKSSDILRQVKAPESFVDIVTLGSDSYELRFYHASQVGALNSTTGLYALSGDPYVTHLVENPDSGQSGVTHRIRFTETRGSAQKVTLYDYDSATGTMTMTSGGGARVDALQKTVAGLYSTETRTVKDGSNQTVSVVQETKYDFPFGQNVTARILDPAGAALTTSYLYYTDPDADGAAYGQTKQMIEPSGRWTTYTYDSMGRAADTISQFLNTAVGSAGSQNRQSSNTYSTISDLDGDGIAETLTTTVDSLLGQETGRSFEVVYSKPQTFNGQTVEVRASIRAVTAGAGWNAADNLVTLSRRIQGGTLDLKPMSVLTPDQVLTLCQYDLTSTTLTTTVWQGQPNSTKDAVVSGTKTITTADLFGNLISGVTSDIASSLTLSGQTVTTADSFGRPTRIDFDNGTYETRSYACCGLDTVRDRTGLTTSYTYDDFGRVTRTSRAGLATLTTFDADGRVLNVSRQGSDNSVIVQQTNTYDVAGRQTSTKDAMNRQTNFAETKDTSGNTNRTSTFADSGTRTELSAPDGSLLSVTGSAAPRQLGYDYGVDSVGVFTKEIHLGISGETTEWVKTYSDLAGRSYKTVYADGAAEQKYFNALGQLIKTTDADGVATLFAYNARGEQEFTAVDLNRNDGIDYTGLDRISRTVSDVSQHGAYTVHRSTTQVWETDNQDTPVTAAVSEQAVDGLHSWQTVRGLATATVIALDGSGGRTVTTTTPDSVQTVQVFSNDRLVSNTVKDAASAQVTAVTYAYDPHGRLLTATDARNGSTSYAYFADDQIQSVTTPDPDTSRSGDGYDPQTTTYAYDAMGRQNAVTQPDATVVNTTYWPTGQVKRSWGSRTYPSEYTYDGQGRVKTFTTWQDFAGDAGRAVTTWTYDGARGWLSSKHYADGQGPSYTYFASGRLHTRLWARGVNTTYTYNDVGDLLGIDYADTTPDVTLTFDRLGRQKTRLDAAGNCTWNYTAAGQLQDEIYSSGLLSGLSVEHDYDSLQRVHGLTASNGATVNSYTYDYDAASRLHVVTQGNGTATYGYAGNSSLIQTVTFAQSGATRLTTTKSYDKLNRLSSITNTPSADAAISVAYDYNSANQRTKATRENNTYWGYTYDSLGQVTAGKKYLADNSPMLARDFGWTYDDIGNRKTATTNTQVSSYTVDNLNRYAQRSVPSVVDVFGSAATDATITVNGQSVQRQGGDWYTTFTYPNANVNTWADLFVTGVRPGGGPGGADASANGTRQVWVPKTPEVFSYDADGNLTRDARWQYSWDGENRLISMETRAEIVAPTGPFPLSERRKLDFGYDAQGRRVSKKVFNWNGSGWQLATSILYLYDGWNMLAELNALSSHAVVNTYVWGADLSGKTQDAGGVGGMLFEYNSILSASDAAAFDGNGNVIGLVDMATGTKSATYDYNAFGETIQSDGVAAVANHFRFSTKYTDDETGLLYYGYRYYAPSTGRWLSRDPIEERGGINLTCLAGNDAIGKWDYLGLMDETIPAVPGGAISPNPTFPRRDGGTPASRDPGNTVGGYGSAVAIASRNIPKATLESMLRYGQSECQKQQAYTGKGCACCTVRVYKITSISAFWGNQDSYVFGFARVVQGSCDKNKPDFDGPEIVPYYAPTDTALARYFNQQTTLTRFYTW